MATLEAPADPRKRVMDFLDAFIAAPPDADLEIMGGMDEHGDPAMAIRMLGKLHGFTTDEARKVADVAESTMRKFPDGAKIWANLILALRGAADRIDADGTL